MAMQDARSRTHDPMLVGAKRIFSESDVQFHERAAAFQEAHADHAREQGEPELANRAELRAAAAHERAERARIRERQAG